MKDSNPIGSLLTSKQLALCLLMTVGLAPLTRGVMIAELLGPATPVAAYNGRWGGWDYHYSPDQEPHEQYWGVYWDGSAYEYLGNHLNSSVWGVWGDQQVGYDSTGSSPNFIVHAYLWSGSNMSAVDLHPAGFVRSRASSNWQGIQVGSGLLGQPRYWHALRWAGSAASVIDLHPPAYRESYASDVFGPQQVGFGVDQADQAHALLWPGPNPTVTDLTPIWAGRAYVNSLDSNQQVGEGYLPGSSLSHAIVWQGTAASAVDLNPPGLEHCVAADVHGGVQVGYGEGLTGPTHALMWTGTANSVVDLHSFLPIRFTDSMAFAIDPVTGDIYGEAWDTWQAPSGDQWVAVRWRNTNVHQLAVHSQNPGSGIGVSATLDVNFRSNGVTPFNRLYGEGAHVALGVGNGVLSGNRLFDHFDLDGSPIAGPLIMDGPHTATAVYVQGYTLSIQSSNPSVGAPMTVWTADYYNRKNGSTPLSRLYKSGQSASVTAPNKVGSQWFERWEKDGAAVPGTAKTITVAMGANHVIKAVYLTGRTLTVSSATPDSGVPITVSPIDRMGYKNGATQFWRSYTEGTRVTLTAPISSGGATFVRWEKEGVPQAAGDKTISVNMIGNRSVKAVYAP